MIFTDGDKIAAAILAAAQLIETRSQAVLESDYRKALELVIRFQTSKEVVGGSVPNIRRFEPVA